MLFGERLKKLRLEKGLTLDDVSDIFDLTKTAISYYENGKRFPKMNTLRKMADFYGVSYDYLVGNDNYEIADDNEEYGLHMSSEEIDFIKEIRKNEGLYKLMTSDPKRFVKLLDKKIN